MGALLMLCSFFFVFPVLALIAALAAVALLAGIVAGTASLLGGLVTYVAAASVPHGLAKLARKRV